MVLNKVLKEVFEFRRAASGLSLALFVCCFEVENSKKQDIPSICIYYYLLIRLDSLSLSLCVGIKIIFRCSTSSLVKSHPQVANVRPNEMNRGRGYPKMIAHGSK